MLKKKVIVGKITNYHLWAAIGIYAGMSIIQIGLPERFENTRQVLTYIQLGLWVILSLLVLINLFRNWK